VLTSFPELQVERERGALSSPKGKTTVALANNAPGKTALVLSMFVQVCCSPITVDRQLLKILIVQITGLEQLTHVK